MRLDVPGGGGRDAEQDVALGDHLDVLAGRAQDDAGGRLVEHGRAGPDGAHPDATDAHGRRALEHKDERLLAIAFARDPLPRREPVDVERDEAPPGVHRTDPVDRATGAWLLRGSHERPHVPCHRSVPPCWNGAPGIIRYRWRPLFRSNSSRAALTAGISDTIGVAISHHELA